jgi:hypothetical protein
MEATRLRIEAVLNRSWRSGRFPVLGTGSACFTSRCAAEGRSYRIGSRAELLDSSGGTTALSNKELLLSAEPLR